MKIIGDALEKFYQRNKAYPAWTLEPEKTGSVPLR